MATNGRMGFIIIFFLRNMPQANKIGGNVNANSEEATPSVNKMKLITKSASFLDLSNLMKKIIDKTSKRGPIIYDVVENQLSGMKWIDQVPYKNAPIVETRIAKSEDKNWIIHQTIITDIKPIGYLKKVLEDS